MESASYLQNTGESTNLEDPNINQEMATFEVDSIELTTPDLFTSNGDDNSFNQDTTEPKIFEDTESEVAKESKEPEMFEEPNLEEDFEIPAFLRRQKN